MKVVPCSSGQDFECGDSRDEDEICSGAFKSRDHGSPTDPAVIKTTAISAAISQTIKRASVEMNSDADSDANSVPPGGALAAASVTTAVVFCAWACAWVLWRLLRPHSPSKPRASAARRQAAPGAPSTTEARARDEAERAHRSRDPVAAGEHNWRAVAAAGELKRNDEAGELERNDVEKVQRTIQRPRSLRRRRSRSRSSDPDGDIRTRMLTFNDMLLHRSMMASTTSAAPPTPISERRVPLGGSGERNGSAATPSRSGQAAEDRLCFRCTPRSASRPNKEADCRARPPSRPVAVASQLVFEDTIDAVAVTDAGEVAANLFEAACGFDAGEILANRYKAVWGIGRAPSLERAEVDRDVGEVLANRYKAAWGIDKPAPSLERAAADGGLRLPDF